MPNILLSADLRQRYAPTEKTEIRAESKSILESLERTGLDSPQTITQLRIASPIVSNLIANPKQALSLLFIDITDFSTTTSSLTSMQITALLDQYYRDVLPIIYQHNGEVEKIMGDGIVAVFGPPFTVGTKRSLLNSAEICASDIIFKRMGVQNGSVKVALHFGDLIYYQNRNVSVPEFYALGKPMTELFRLESESINNYISFFSGSDYHTHRRAGYSILSSYWVERAARAVALKGVSYNQVIDLH